MQPLVRLHFQRPRTTQSDSHWRAARLFRAPGSCPYEGHTFDAGVAASRRFTPGTHRINETQGSHGTHATPNTEHRPDIASLPSSCLKEAPCCPSGRSNHALMLAPGAKLHFLRATSFTRCFFGTNPVFVAKISLSRRGAHATRAYGRSPFGSLSTKIPPHRRPNHSRSSR